MDNPEADRTPTRQAREAIEIVCSGDLSRMGDYYSADFVDHVNDMVHRGHEGIHRSFDLYRGIFDEFRFEVEEQVSEGDRVASRWVLRGTCRGRRVELRGITISRLDADGHVAEDWGFADTFSLLRQLGVLRTLLLGVEVLVGRVKVPKAEAQPAAPGAPEPG